jgi:hypothetical protein
MHFNRPVRGFYHRARPSFRGEQFSSRACIRTVLDVDEPALRGLVDAHLGAYLWRTGVEEARQEWLQERRQERERLARGDHMLRASVTA